MQTENKKILISVLVFVVTVLIFTRLDFLINSVLYEYGLIFSKNWYNEYTILYNLLYQIVIFGSLVYTKNVKLFVSFELFVISCSQDLIYFAIWEKAFPSVNWSWMLFNDILGFWNTESQIILTAITLLSIMCIWYIIPKIWSVNK